MTLRNFFPYWSFDLAAVELLPQAAVRVYFKQVDHGFGCDANEVTCVIQCVCVLWVLMLWHTLLNNASASMHPMQCIHVHLSRKGTAAARWVNGMENEGQSTLTHTRTGNVTAHTAHTQPYSLITQLAYTFRKCTAMQHHQLDILGNKLIPLLVLSWDWYHSHASTLNVTVEEWRRGLA